MLPLFHIYKFQSEQISIPGFMVISTAPVNVEERNPPKNDFPGMDLVPDLGQAIFDIARQLQMNKDVELVITIHGYNTSVEQIQGWYKDIFKYINQDNYIKKSKNRVFLGYRWPSEKAVGQLGFFKTLVSHLQALPFVPRGILLLSFFGMLLCGSLFIGLKLWWLGIFTAVLSLILGIFFALVVLRFSVYFRDSYRASNYAVPDLVELIRQLDKAMVDSGFDWQRNKIKLSFIGHSMGGFVVTNVVRIISDVFDDRSVGILDNSITNKEPDSEVGRVFELSRLLLVSPDIPADTLIQGRANFLHSSLRRFKESYLFSNEGDLALKLASSAANYINFPAKTRQHGYRLGNVVVNSGVYGVINNLPATIQSSTPPIMHRLRVDYATARLDLAQVSDSLNIPSSAASAQISLADRFTYFDCTDYFDTTNYRGKEGAIGVLTHAKRKLSLNFIDYTFLAIAYFFLGKDVHGGYFRGDFSRLLLYRLAFLGMDEFLDSLDTENQWDKSQQLAHLSTICTEKGIQIVLSNNQAASLGI